MRPDNFEPAALDELLFLKFASFISARPRLKFGIVIVLLEDRYCPPSAGVAMPEGLLLPKLLCLTGLLLY